MPAQTTTAEQIWRGDFVGLYAAFGDAEKLDRQGKTFEADVVRASALYSYSSNWRHPVRSLWNFWVARHYTSRAVRHVRRQTPEISHGQCDVLATILLRGWLWMRPSPREAMALFQIGLNLPDVPPHSRALMMIGVAEAHYLLGDSGTDYIWAYIRAAMMYEGLTKEEQDQKLAHRQFCRVLRRAMVLEWRIGGKVDAIELRNKARIYAKHPEYGSADQLRKIHDVWDRLRHPRFWHCLLPQ